MDTETEIPWKVIDKMFNDNPYTLVSHHLDSYNDFFKTGLPRILMERNPIKILKKQFISRVIFFFIPSISARETLTWWATY